MNADLLRAILSMDAYNRGYGAKIDLTGTAVGNAVIGKDSSVLVDQYGNILDKPAGFYAISYTWNGKQTISFRGTDDADGSGSDKWNGWTLGAGFSSASQGGLALDFFKAVTGRSVFDPTVNDVSLVGHSLGGGLAEYVGMLSGNTAYGYDHRPFGAAAYAEFMSEFSRRAVQDGKPADTIPTAELLARYSLHYPTFAGFSAVATEGEVNSGLRDGSIAMTIGSTLGLIPFVGPFLNALGGTIAGGQIAAEANIHTDVLSTFDWTKAYDNALNFPPLSDRHSDATLILLEYAKQHEADTAFAKWHSAGVANDLLNALYSNDVALAAGAFGITGVMHTKNDYASIMRTALAYSAIDEGTRVFGDTGIVSLFDDASDLGNALDRTDGSTLLKQSAGALAEALAEFAGKLALGKVEGGASSALANGVLTLSSDQKTLAVNFNAERWSYGAAHSSIVGRDTLITKALATVGDDGGQAGDLTTGMTWLWGSASTSIIDRVEFATTNAATTRTLPASDNAGTSVTLFAAGGGADTITGSADSEIIAGDLGNDRSQRRHGRRHSLRQRRAHCHLVNHRSCDRPVRVANRCKAMGS